MALSWDPKDPQEVLANGINWATRLAEGDTIQTSVWAITNVDDDGALVIDTSEHSDTSTTVWLSGGTLGKRYSLTNTITTAQGWTRELTVKLKIKSK